MAVNLLLLLHINCLSDLFPVLGSLQYFLYGEQQQAMKLIPMMAKITTVQMVIAT